MPCMFSTGSDIFFSFSPTDLYLLEFWREQTDTPDENLEVLTKTMEPLQKRLFIKNQNDILSGLVRNLYDARPDVYQYFTTRLLIPPPTVCT